MKNIYFVQPNDRQTFLNKEVYWLPYSVGTIWAYANQFEHVRENYKLVEVVFRREEIHQLVGRITPDSIIAFSCYLWNWEYNKKLAETIKQTYPDCYIVFGGPQVSNRPIETDFFKHHPYVDSILIGEGEQAFTDLLTDYVNGKTTRIHRASRIENLEIPSPYQSGFFDRIIQENPNCQWNAVLETNRGCPFSCTFCDWGGLVYSKVKKISDNRVYGDIEWFGKNQVQVVVIADANFGIFKERDLAIIHKIGEVRAKYQHPTNVSLNHNKNQTKDIIGIVQALADTGINRGLMLSFQSLNSDTLKAIKRDNMNLNKAEEIFKEVNASGLAHFSELLCPLPLETLESWKTGLTKLLEMGQHQCIDVFFVSVLENSELNHPEYKRQYQIQEIETEYVYFYNSNGVISEETSAEVVEKVKLVSATSTMNINDHMQAWAYSWLIVNLHTYGWTQIYSRFLRKYKDIGYKEFYDQLMSEIKENKMGVISDQYNEMINSMKYFLSGDKEKLKELNPDPDMLRNSQKHFHINRIQVEESLRQYIKRTYILDSKIFDNLDAYQHHFISDYTQTYPYVETLDIGIGNYCLNNLPYTPNLVKCNIDVVGKFFSQDEFFTRIIASRRNGFGKNQFNKI